MLGTAPSTAACHVDLLLSDLNPADVCIGDDLRHDSAVESDRIGLRNAFAHGTRLHDMYSNGHCIVGVLRAHARILQVPLRARCSDCSLHWLAHGLSHSDTPRQNATFTKAHSCFKMRREFKKSEVGVVLVERLTPLEPNLKDWEPWLASVLLGLLLLLLMFEGRLALMRSQPDDFMGILIIMNGSMMSVVSRLPHRLAAPFRREGGKGPTCVEVSVPFFVIIYGFLYMTREEDSDPNSVRATEEEPQPHLDDVPHPLAVGEP